MSPLQINYFRCNCETIYNALRKGNNDDTMKKTPPLVIINGALDKLRGGYYNKFIFPKLAGSIDRFFTKFESVFYLKPISDKGAYGWLYRVYPEPWQVVLQRVKPKGVKNRQQQPSAGPSAIENIRVFVSEQRPTYLEAVAKLVEAASSPI